MSIEEIMHGKKLYLPMEESLLNEQLSRMDKVCEYNALLPSQMKERAELLKQIFADVGEGCYVQPPFYSVWGGKHVHFGKGVYANYNLTLIDDTHIYVGDYTMFGPNVVIATAGHPILPELRQKGYQYNASIKIGKNCWIGAGVIIVPGVTIGDNVVVGAGSVVTKDIPDNVVAVGNPCHVMRTVSQRDKEFYFKDKKIPQDLE